VESRQLRPELWYQKTTPNMVSMAAIAGKAGSRLP
jgi:hypothetical protein